MSYCLFPIVIDIDRLNSTLGSGDAKLIAAIDGADDPENPVHELIMGTSLQGEPHEYGYALIELCEHTGTPILVNNWGAVRWAALEVCGLEDVLQTGPPVSIPPYDDFPVIGHVRRNDLQQHIDAALSRRDKSDDEDIEEMLDEYVEWLTAAQSQNCDIMLCYH